MVKDKHTTLFLGFALVVGFILRCWNINQSFWWDEIWSTMTFVKADSLWAAVSTLGYYFNNHILYTLLARSFVSVLGESEFAARLPAVIMGLLGMSALFSFGRENLSSRCGVLSALLLSLAPFHIDHSSEARGYSGLALFSILSSFYFLKALKYDEVKNWIYYVLFTVLGFYSHVFMMAVSLSQFSTLILIVLIRRYDSTLRALHPKVLTHFLLSLVLAGSITLLIYSPVIPAFIANMGKVQFGSVSRLPFLLILTDSLLPGSVRSPGIIIYSLLFFFGMKYVLKKEKVLFVYLIVLFVLPLFLYLLLNPMFVFERYFIFILPFALLIISQGIVGLADKLDGIYSKGFIAVAFSVLVFVQLPNLAAILSQDRQNYREAVRYVSAAMKDEEKGLIFTIGYAGEHFKYYAPGKTIATPETPYELTKLMQGKEQVWCLVTAWLPDIRPPYEDKALYSEQPGQTKIYNEVRRRFNLLKTFSSKYPVEIYYLQR
jgi:uncharacterized membrane protein